MASAQSTIPCAAVPRVVARGWRTDVGCASSASVTVEYEGDTWHVCLIHQARWELAVERGTEDLVAREWGWV